MRRPMQLHPVIRLRSIARSDFSDELPPKVRAVPEWISDPQFFPGATGLITEDSWQAVVPGRAGPFKQLPAPPKGGVVVLGNYFSSVKTYERVRAAELGGLKTTWARLGQLLAATSPREVFLTNAYIGLVDADTDTGRFPSNQEFEARCADFLRLEIELFSPRAVVCLGVGAARMLARVAPDRLGEWGRTSFRVLTEREERVVEGCQAGGMTFTAAAVYHPSAVLTNEQREHEAGIVSAAVASASPR